MFEWLTRKVKKEEFDKHKTAVQTALNNAKNDVINLTKWVKHLNSNDSEIKNDVENVYEELSTVKGELEELKNMVSLAVNPGLFKQRQTTVGKQTAVEAVQSGVQTTVQAAFLERLSLSEKAVLMILLNSDMKLSYEDLATMMGKDSATIRGQVNSIKQKCEGLIEEQIEKNNKKRLFIPEGVKEILLKKARIRGKRG